MVPYKNKIIALFPLLNIVDQTSYFYIRGIQLLTIFKSSFITKSLSI